MATFLCSRADGVQHLCSPWSPPSEGRAFVNELPTGPVGVGVDLRVPAGAGLEVGGAAPDPAVPPVQPNRRR